PVTEAERESAAIILAGLRAPFAGTPRVAEGAAASGATPVEIGDEFCLVDPPGATQEFVKRRGEVTGNTALLRSGGATLGVVFAPCSGHFFAGRPGLAERLAVDDEFRIAGRSPVRVSPAANPLRVVVSRSHNTPQTEAYVAALEAAELVSIGSSLKFCLLASGE